MILKRIKAEPRGIVFSGKKSIDQIFKEREKLYEKYADFVVDATQNTQDILKQICDTIFIENNNIC